MTGGLFAVLDDIAVLLDDAAVMSKVAAKKTAGILGDDLAVNAERATGFRASRELPVLWAITKGSFINKVIIVPLALLLIFVLLYGTFNAVRPAVLIFLNVLPYTKHFHIITAIPNVALGDRVIVRNHAGQKRNGQVIRTSKQTPGIPVDPEASLEEV